MYVSDSNNNVASVKRWGSEEAALAALKTLANCSNCSDCSKCSNCSDCSDCSNCTNCTNCTKCSYCTNCSNCSNCLDCLDCSYCSTQPKINTLLGKWTVTITSTHISIGCKRYTIEEWQNFTDNDIQAMEYRALNYWNTYKSFIMSATLLP